MFLNAVQILEDESFKPLQDLVEELLEKSDQNKQRGAAELMAGLLGGMVLSVLLKLPMFDHPNLSQVPSTGRWRVRKNCGHGPCLYS